LASIPAREYYKPENNAYPDHAEAQELSHGEASQDKSEMLVRFPEILYDYSEDTITNQKESGNAAVWPTAFLVPGFFSQSPQKGEKHDPF